VRERIKARVACGENMEVISKVERTAVRRSLHRLVRPHTSEAGRRMGRNEMPSTLCVESAGANPKLR